MRSKAGGKNRENTTRLTARKKGFVPVVMLLAIFVLLAGAYVLYPSVFSGMGANPAGYEPALPANLPAREDVITFSVAAVGDIMVHKPQIASQYDSATGTYNYDNNFAYVKKYIGEADLALCNVETTFAGGTPTGYPSFNAPDALADTLAGVGFDVALTSNNHLYDKGTAGLKRTLQMLREAGLATAGTRLPWERDYALVTIKGIQIAIVSYTYETPMAGGKTTINSVVLPDTVEPLVTSFAYETLDEDLLKVQNTIESAREAGADLVICYYHWGEEYQQQPNQWQEYIAEKTVAMGADMIFASHPHVLQKMDLLQNPATGKNVPVYYSMGNFLSNQRRETVDNRYTEQGMIARVEVTYSKDQKEIKAIAMDSINTWMEKYTRGGKDIYAIIPLDDELENNEVLRASGHLKRAVEASLDATSVLGTNYTWKE